ncbi:MAG TPA: hypothetical protein VF618_08395 [Thermoanaerobaculia bacterium]
MREERVEKMGGERGDFEVRLASGIVRARSILLCTIPVTRALMDHGITGTQPPDALPAGIRVTQAGFFCGLHSIIMELRTPCTVCR